MTDRQTNPGVPQAHVQSPKRMQIPTMHRIQPIVFIPLPPTTGIKSHSPQRSELPAMLRQSAEPYKHLFAYSTEIQMLQTGRDNLWQRSTHVKRLAGELKIFQHDEPIERGRLMDFVDPVIAPRSRTYDFQPIQMWVYEREALKVPRSTAPLAKDWMPWCSQEFYTQSSKLGKFGHELLQQRISLSGLGHSKLDSQTKRNDPRGSGGSLSCMSG